MKYVGENALKKWTSLVKSDIKKKLDKNQGTANSGKILGVDATGEVTPTDTEIATLVDVPNGIVKGDGSTLSAAVAGTDYVEPSELDEKLAANGLPFEVKILETICENIELNPASNTYTFPTALTLNAGDSYYLKYQHYTEGVLDSDINRIAYIIPDATQIKWAGEQGKHLIMTATGLTDSRVTTTDTKSIISLYKVENTTKKDLENVEMRSEGTFTSASGDGAHAEGIFTLSEDTASHAEGYLTTSSNLGSHAEGYGTTASGMSSHAEGYNTKATGSSSHTEGTATAASGSDSHAEGAGSKATGNNSHAEGSNTTASGNSAHAEGNSTKATANYSHVEGALTEATSAYSHVQGMYNIKDTTGNATTKGKYAHIVGNGTASNLSNAHTLDWDGNAWFAGDVYTGGTAQDSGATKLMATPTGGTAGQVLTKTADGQEWQDREKDLFVVTISGDDSSGYTADKTFSEIKAAYDEGKTVVAITAVNSMISPLFLVYITDGLVQFTAALSDAGDMSATLSIAMDKNNNIARYLIYNQVVINASGLLKGDGNGSISAATAGTDYMVPPTGGTAGQVLTKTANSSEWADAPKSLPDGGIVGDALVKNTDGGSWETPVEASLVDLPVITASQTDLTAGTSPLATGELYVVYE